MSRKKADIFQEYARDIMRYLSSKLPDIPPHTAMEIGEYVSARTSNLVTDIVNERDADWRREWRRNVDAIKRGAGVKVEDDFPNCKVSGCEAVSKDCHKTCPYGKKEKENDRMGNGSL